MDDKNHKNRVLGRVLAVEEIKTVSGARNTYTYRDGPILTTVEADSFVWWDNPQP